jgi:hypothetical protein
VLRIDRNARARLIYFAEALDRRTHEPGQHGGVLKRTGLAVLKALVFGFLGPGGRCDPSLGSLARRAGCARSTVTEALKRLEAAGLVRRIARWQTVAANGGLVVLQLSNAYLFPLADAAQRPAAGHNPPPTPLNNLKAQKRGQPASGCGLCSPSSNGASGGSG